MTPPAGQPILTAVEMRGAEDRAIAAGASVEALMTRAGEGVARAVRRLAAGGEVMIACGPGNNGGDGYIAAAVLRDLGQSVRVAAVEGPRTEAAAAARLRWGGTVEPLVGATPAPVLVDALFGTGGNRRIEGAIADAMGELLDHARLPIAVDLPSGVDANRATLPAWLERRRFALTLALGALKPAHVLHPATEACGTTRVIDLGLGALPHATSVAVRPHLPAPDARSHKYSRGQVAIVVGTMAGAARLAGVAAFRAGAGYVALFGDAGQGGPDAVVHRRYDADALADTRVGAILIGPGLGRDDEARTRVRALIAADTHPLVIDGDALHLIASDDPRARRQPTILTPHAGEFHALFGDLPGSLIDQVRAAAAISTAIVVLKGPTTLVGYGNDVVVHPGGNPWLSTAGTGDVLAGAITAQAAHPDADPFLAASAGVWLHARAARIAGASFIADDLANALTAARAGA